jgi:hypothetical protein
MAMLNPLSGSSGITFSIEVLDLLVEREVLVEGWHIHLRWVTDISLAYNRSCSAL